MTTKEDIALIKAFIDNTPLVDAVKRVMLPDEEIAAGVPIIDDAAYGRSVRAWVGARDLVRARFAELSRIARGNPQPTTRNESR